MQIRRLADGCQTKSKVLHERITHHRLKHVFIARKVIFNFSCVVLSHKIHTFKPNSLWTGLWSSGTDHRKLVTSILKTFHHFNRSSADNIAWPLTALSSSLFFSRSPTSYRTPRGVGLLEDMSSFLCPGGLGTPDFEWQGWSKDLLGFEIFDFGIFWGRKILAGIFQFGKVDLSRIFLGIRKNLPFPNH